MRAAMLAVAVVGASAGPLWAGPIFFNPGNGHSYQIEDVVMGTWAQAQADAVSRGGYLATITSLEENQFLWDAAKAAGYYLGGYWLGGFQPAGSAEPNDGWQWVTGEAWSYTAWSVNEPNQSGEEDVLVYWGPYVWNDLAPGFDQHYIIEYEAVSAVPEPGSLALLGTGAVGLFFVARRKMLKAALVA